MRMLIILLLGVTSCSTMEENGSNNAKILDGKGLQLSTTPKRLKKSENQVQFLNCRDLSREQRKLLKSIDPRTICR